MDSFKRVTNITGWLVFAIATVVYAFSIQPTTSLWDCGEFIAGAYKLQVVHPPGAPLFLLVGRVFISIADLFFDLEAHPEYIAQAVNMMSGIFTALAAMFVAWVAMILGKLALVGREGQTDAAQHVALAGTGLVAGLATAFATSIWFSAVEGEVYAMSTFFTTLTLWAMVHWYHLPDSPKADRWVLFAVFSAGLSIGVHLLSLLTFPALALLYYFKKYERHTWKGMAVAALLGLVMVGFIQKFIIAGIPQLWAWMELLTVNGLGMPIHSGLVPTIAILVALIWLGLYQARKRNSYALHMLTVGAALVVIGFSTIGVVVIRANANPPINMNDPSDPMRLLPYLNREQYGERPLLYGPYFDAQPVSNEIEERYGRVGDHYEIVDEKVSYVYRNADKMFFPRMGDPSQNRPAIYRQWINKPTGKPTFFDNLEFLFSYQIGWMYWRYFMWNFAGRQNGEQGFYSWDKKSGHWASGIKWLDELRLYNMDHMPETMMKHRAWNKYFLLPFLFGLLGLFYHARRRPEEFLALLTLFIITGIGIIIYSNQPPNEPRERDYVLVGSFFTWAIWIGMGVLAVFELLREQLRLSPNAAASLASVVVLSAPVVMGLENFDDHSRRHITAPRDYAANFLESCAPNAILFTYGDNDTYPLWYAQEVEGIRTDVRVVNLSLIAVDWYINQLRRKVNDSPPIKLSIPADAYRGRKRNSVVYYNPSGVDREMSLQAVLEFIGEDHPLVGQGGRKVESYLPTKKIYLPVDKNRARQLGMIGPNDTTNVVDRIPIKISRNYLIKDDLAILDLIASNIWERPIYFAVTCRPEKMFGMQDYTQLEGLALRLVPVKSQSDRSLGIYGSGRVAVDRTYDIIMNKWRWGNFDKMPLYVDHAFGPSIQSMRVVMLRTARVLNQRGDKERAVALCEQYFKGFPHFNFPYDYNAMYFIRVMVDAGAYDKAKPHIDILANEMADWLEFYFSLDPALLEPQASFGQDFALALRTKDDILNVVRAAGDEEYAKQLEALFAPYSLDRLVQ